MNVTIGTLLAVTYNTILISLTYLIARYGGRDEKLGISVIFLGSLFTAMSTLMKAHPFESVELVIVSIDFVVLAIFVSMATTSKRFWPIWAASFQLSAMLTHLSDYLIGKPIPAAYSFLQGFFAYPMMICILLATFGHQQVLRQKQK